MGLSASFASSGFDRTSFAASMLPPGGNVSAADIASLRLVLCEVRVIRTGGGNPADAEADEAPACQGGAAWTKIPLEATEIDLFALEEGEVVEITFANDVTIGNRSYAADVEFPLRIPGAANSGIKIPSSHFDVVADAEEAIVLIFDETSISSVRATGQGIQMSPVLREADQAVEEDLAEGSDEAGSG